LQILKPALESKWFYSMPLATQKTSLIIRHLGLQEFSLTFEAMKSFVARRNEDSSDEIWFLEHHPVFTQGQAGKSDHIIAPGDIPVIKTDRGGQVTYHGPGQITAYLMIDLKRLNMGVRDLVSLIEQALVDCLRFSVLFYDRAIHGEYRLNFMPRWSVWPQSIKNMRCIGGSNPYELTTSTCFPAMLMHP
jgi:hypothetical protein